MTGTKFSTPSLYLLGSNLDPPPLEKTPFPTSDRRGSRLENRNLRTRRARQISTPYDRFESGGSFFSKKSETPQPYSQTTPFWTHFHVEDEFQVRPPHWKKVTPKKLIFRNFCALFDFSRSRSIRHGETHLFPSGEKIAQINP